MSRLRTEAEGALGLRCDFVGREMLLQANPDVFFITEHYRNSPGILIRLERIDRDVLRQLVERAWRMTALQKLVAAFDTRTSATSPDLELPVRAQRSPRRSRARRLY